MKTQETIRPISDDDIVRTQEIDYEFTAELFFHAGRYYIGLRQGDDYAVDYLSTHYESEAQERFHDRCYEEHVRHHGDDTTWRWSESLDD